MAHYRKKPSGLWQAEVYHPSGRRYTKTDPLKGVVKDWAEDLEASIRRGEFVDPKAGRMTVAQWWDRWSATRTVEDSTAAKDLSRWRTHVEPHWGQWPLASVASWDVEAWAAKMHKDGVGAQTRAAAIRLLRHMMDAAVKHKLLAANPVMVAPPKIPRHVDRFLSLEEFARLHAAFSGADATLVHLLAYTGLRWAEAAGLHAHRVDLGRRRIEVVETLRRDGSIKAAPKSLAGRRMVPLTPRLAEDVAPLLGGGLVFRSSEGAPLHYPNWRRRVWLPGLASAGLADPQPTIHDLRHTYGSWLAELGVPVAEIMELMGHSSLRATERYVHASEQRMGRARRALQHHSAPTPPALTSEIVVDAEIVDDPDNENSPPPA